MANKCRLPLCYLLISTFGYHSILSERTETDPEDVAVLRSLRDQWKNTPVSWRKSDDPCGDFWEGVTCTNSRVTKLGLSTLGLLGQLVGDIGGLTQLISLDLSYNRGLTGWLPPNLGDLKNLYILILAGCSFTGNIPSELGNLAQLSFLDLNSNKLSGKIPPSLGNLSKLYWLDLAENQLAGFIPVSTANSPGLDHLKNAKHLHLSNNKLSGDIPEQLFTSDMALVHVLFDGNLLTGEIPHTIGYVQTLENLQLDQNALNGSVPSNLNNLTNLIELSLANNEFSGPLPNLTGMHSLNYLDLSNNSFEQSQAPEWFTSLQSLSTLIIEHGRLVGSVPDELFSLSQIQQVKLRNNAFHGSLVLGANVSSELQLVDFQDNNISFITVGSKYNNTLILTGNPVCSTLDLADTKYCQLQQQSQKPYSTNTSNCVTKSCPSDEKLSPLNCDCAYPYEGMLYFRAPSFRDVSNAHLFHELEMSLWVKLGLHPGSVSVQDPFFNLDDYLQVQLLIFPSPEKSFNRSEIQRLGSALFSQTYEAPEQFGPYYIIPALYHFTEYKLL